MSDRSDWLTPEQLERSAEQIEAQIDTAPSFDDDPAAEVMVLLWTTIMIGVAATFRKCAAQQRELEARCARTSN